MRVLAQAETVRISSRSAEATVAHAKQILDVFSEYDLDTRKANEDLVIDVDGVAYLVQQRTFQ